MSDLDRKRISAVEMLEKRGYQWTDGAWRPPFVLYEYGSGGGSTHFTATEPPDNLGKDK